MSLFDLRKKIEEHISEAEKDSYLTQNAKVWAFNVALYYIDNEIAMQESRLAGLKEKSDEAFRFGHESEGNHVSGQVEELSLAIGKKEGEE